MSTGSCGVNPTAEQSWGVYARSVLAFSAVSILFLYLFLRVQDKLWLSLGMPAVTDHVAWNTAVSFVSNTNWQAYAGESTMGHLVQMAGLAVQNFVSAGVGIDLLFLAANLTKLAHGAWLPLLIGLTAFTVMTTWQRGRQVVTRERERAEGSLRAVIDRLCDDRPPLTRVPGTAVFLNRGKQTAPLAVRANVEHNHVLYEQILIVSVETLPVPHLPDADRIQVDDLGYTGDGIVHVSARFGYLDTQDVAAALRLLEPDQTEGPVSLAEASYFLSKIAHRRVNPGAQRSRSSMVGWPARSATTS